MVGAGPADDLRLALRLGVTEVVELPVAEAWLVEQLTDLDDPASGRGLVLGVVGGSGGAGATTFACALGQVAATDGPALVVDTDPRGPGLDRVLGVEDAPGRAVGRPPPRGGPAVARAPCARRSPRATGWASSPGRRPPTSRPRWPPCARCSSAARRGHHVVVVDLPRSEDAVTDELVARCDELVVVARPSVLGLAATARLCARHATATCRVVVRGRGVLERDVAALTGVERVVVMGDQRRLDEAVDLGLGPLRRPARSAVAGRSGGARGRRTTGAGAVTAAVPPGLVDRVRDRLADGHGDLTPQRVAEVLREEGRPVGDATVLAVHEALRRDVVGAGPLEPLLRTPGVTDVLVNGPGQVFWDRGRGLEPAGVTFPDDGAVRRLAQRLAASGGRRLDDASPYVDVRLADGTRFHAVLAPVSRPGTVLSLRVPAARTFTLDDLEAGGFLVPETRRLLAGLVAGRLAFLVSGGTGTGKTTLLGSLLAAVPGDQRLVVVEDSAELRPDHPHVVTPRGATAQHRGHRRDHPAHAGAPGAADAARPAGRRRGARRRGGRPAGRA